MLSAALLAAAVAPLLAVADLPHTPVFTWGESGYFGFREPSLLLLPATEPPLLLAIAEAGTIDDALTSRVASPPLDPFCCDIIGKRSTDKGVSWSPLAVVLRNASQPSTVWDTRSHRVILNADGSIVHGLSGAALQTTSEDGITWSPRSELGPFLGYSHPAPLATGLELFTGPHKNRLLFIGWRSPTSGQHPPSVPRDMVWYTDDSGQTYRPSNTTITTGGEAQLVQNDHGTVIANIRDPQSMTLGRAVATSTDSGTTFSNITYDHDLKVQNCEASFFRSPQNGNIYFSSPHHWTTSDSGSRVAGTIRRSKTGLPGSWSPRTFRVNNHTMSFGYSSLSDHPDKGKAGMLWETILCGPDRRQPMNNCTCGGRRPNVVQCVEKPQCKAANCAGAIVFSSFALDF